MKTINKPWGYEQWVEVNGRYVVKRLFMRKGNQCSLQYHKEKTETIIILKGTLTITKNKKRIHLKPFDPLTIKPGQIHRMIAEGGDCLYLECSTPELKDVVRIEDQYGRIKSA